FAQKFIVIADDSKFSKVLKGPVPLELLPFAYSFVEKAIKKEFGIKTELRRRENGDVWKSDNGNFIADAHFRSIKNPKKLEGQLNAIPGIVENGIFSKNVSTVIIGYEKKVRVLK
ncbi:MAG: ribose-5-phosphate isomerase A, partial [Candidatus Micrarchaeota archaeon]